MRKAAKAPITIRFSPSNSITGRTVKLRGTTKVKGPIVNNKLTLEFDGSPFDAIKFLRKESNKLFVICVNTIFPKLIIKTRQFEFSFAS